MSEQSWLGRRLRERTPRRFVVPKDVESARNARGRPAGQSAGKAPGRRRMVVCGDDPLALRLIEELLTRYNIDVWAIVPNVRRNHGPQILKLLGKGNVVESERLDMESFRRAGVSTATVLALVKQDDVGNIHAALQAQELNADLRLVIRMFNMNLGFGIVKLFRECRVLSDASMAAPAFVAAALGEVAPMHVRLARRTLYVARRSDVQPDDVVCGLAVTAPIGEPDLLPADQDRADLVLAVATGERAHLVSITDDDHHPDESTMVAVQPDRPASSKVPGRFRMWLRRQRKRPFGALRKLVSRRLRVAAVVLVALLALGTLVLSIVDEKLSWFDAAYITILSALGGADADPSARWPAQLMQMLLTFVSIALIPVLTAAVVEAVVNTRLAVAQGRLTEAYEDHVVVVGLGNVGTRVIRRLKDLGVSVVAIDKSETAKGIQTARTSGVPVIIGDASQSETLRAASVQTCRALVVASTDDVSNLEAALQGRGMKPDLRVVLRLFDGDFADRVQKVFGITTSRSVSYLAAPAFAAAMLEREVIGTIPVNRRILLIAEAPICPGSALDGAPMSAAHGVGEVRVIALVDANGVTEWSPTPDRVLRPAESLVVVATRRGLGGLLNRTADPARNSREAAE